MPKPRTAANQKRKPSKLIEKMEKLAAALERNSNHKRAHHFGKLESCLSDFELSWEIPEEA